MCYVADPSRPTVFRECLGAVLNVCGDCRRAPRELNSSGGGGAHRSLTTQQVRARYTQPRLPLTVALLLGAAPPRGPRPPWQRRRRRRPEVQRLSECPVQNAADDERHHVVVGGHGGGHSGVIRSHIGRATEEYNCLLGFFKRVLVLAIHCQSR